VMEVMKHLHNDPVLKYRRRELRRNSTAAEKRFWAQVRNKQFFGMKFFRQYSVGSYVLDFYCPLLKLAIELDGGQHGEEDNKVYDKTRTDYLKSLNIEVIRFWNHQVLENMEEIFMEIKKRGSSS